MNSEEPTTDDEVFNGECVRQQIFRCSFERVISSLEEHFTLDGITTELDKICSKRQIKMIHDRMVDCMKTDLISQLDLSTDIACKLKILEEVTKEGLYDKQPKWRPSGNVQETVAPHLISAKSILKEQLEKELEKETAEVCRLREEVAMKRKMFLKLRKKYNDLSEQDSKIHSTLESLAVLQTDTLSSLKEKLDKME